MLSTSWGICEPEISPAQQAAETTLFEQAAAQGQTVVAASGDSGSSDCYNPEDGDDDTGLSVDDPADQPDVTGVGGTSLSTFSPGAPVESVWNSDGGGSGGGNSIDFAAPAWQQIRPSSRSRHQLQLRAPADLSVPGGARRLGVGRPEPRRHRLRRRGMDDPRRDERGVAAVGRPDRRQQSGLRQPCRLPQHQALSGRRRRVAAFQRRHRRATTTSSAAPSTRPPPATTWPRAGAHRRPAPLLGTFTGSAAGCPSVTGLSPSQGPAVGGTTVVVSGSGFGSGVPVVRFGSATADVVAHTPTTIIVTTPDVTFGQHVTVTVTTTGTAGGTSAAVSAAGYTFVSPQVTSVVPNRGPTTGGGQVTVHGSDFSGATSVRFGSVEASSFRVTSSTSLTAQVPPGPPGGATVDVVVTNPDGRSPVVSADRYTYALPGYWLVASDGGIFAFGHAGFFGSTGNIVLNKPVVGMAATPDDKGYWLVASDGGIFSYGDAAFYGSTGNIVLNKPVVGMAATPDGKGYWLVASDGGIFSFGDAAFYGSTGNLVLNKPVVGMAATPDGKGYWLVASDGGIFSFGDAAFYGSTGNLVLNQPVVGMAATPDGKGYWLVASDGGIFSFGDAAFYGSTGNIVLNQPVVGMATSLTGRGYWLVASDGGIFSYGDATFYGSTGDIVLNQPVVGMAAT